MTMIFDRLLGFIFDKSSKSSNIGLTCAFASLFSLCALVPVCIATGSSYLVGLCVNLAIVSAVVSFSAQTISQIIRFISAIMAKFTGRKPRVFKEEDPLYAKFIKKTFKATKEKGANLFRTTKAISLSNAFRVNVHVRANARAYRSASRPAFTRSSGEGSSDNSGESDSGDSPGPSYLLTFPPFFPFSCSFRKLNSFSRPQHFSSRYGCWHVRRHIRFFWRWSA